MPGPRRKPRFRQTSAASYDGDPLDDESPSSDAFGERSRHSQRRRMEQTAILRATAGESAADIESLPIGLVTQVYSRFVQVESDTGPRLCEVRKTLTKMAASGVIVGDMVRFRDSGTHDEANRRQASIEQVLPRRTVLTRAGSFDSRQAQPIVANADQMLIVASLRQPTIKWGLIDRMLIAAKGGGLTAIIALTKLDLAEESDDEELAQAQAALAHYQSLGFTTLYTSLPQSRGVAELSAILHNKTTVLAGHSGVGKSSLISAIEPTLDIRIAPVSLYTDKGIHTTTSARRYPLATGGHVIDTPGVKMFGLWNVTPDNLIDHFPDVQAETAPEWRMQSYQRILESLQPG
jgi:ribosome biogenesis GTPase